MTDSSEAGIVAVDLGNTAAKVLVSEQHQDTPQRFRLSDEAWPLQVIGWANANAARVQAWRIATVNRSASDQLQAAIDAYPGDGRIESAPVQRIAHGDIPLCIDVPHPEHVGIDRLLGAYGASLCGVPSIVVDAGSAVTIDYVDADHVYHGGAILPGLTMQACALASGTDLLPQIVWTDGDDLQVPARDTVSAIRLGILTNIAAAVDRLVGQYARHETAPPKLVLTGGDAIAIRPYLMTPCLHDPGLVCNTILSL